MLLRNMDFLPDRNLSAWESQLRAPNNFVRGEQIPRHMNTSMAQTDVLRPDSRLVFALDFGTTFTGFAHGVIEGDQTDLDLTSIQPVHSWPKNDRVKVPSLIAEGFTLNGNRQWGKDIDPTSFVVSLMKLELEPQERVEELRSMIALLKGVDNLNAAKLAETRHGFPNYPAKTTVEVVMKYLTHIREHVIDYFESDPSLGRHSGARARIPIDLVITVPVEWSDAARNRTFQAVTRAGFSTRYFPTLRKVVMVPEPEAAAEYTLRSVHKDPTFAFEVHRDDSFVLCDAGGGTVDLVSYQIVQTTPEFRTRKISLGCGARCGGTFVDQKFKEWLHLKLGNETYEQLIQGSRSETVMGEHMRRVMEKFDFIKCAFGSRGAPTENYIELPSFIDDDPDNDIQSGELRITQEEMESFFAACIDEICELIACQIVAVDRAGSVVRSIFVSGGFAESDYLLQEIKTFAQRRRIEVHRGPSPQAAVLIGAVARGMGFGSGELVSVVACPQSFGIHLIEGYEAWRHAENDAVVDQADGTTKAAGQVSWLITQDEAITSGRPKKVSKSIRRRFPMASFGGGISFTETIIACKEKGPPASLDRIPRHMQKVYQLKYTLTAADAVNFLRSKGEKDKKRYYTARLQLSFELQNVVLQPLRGQLRATISLQGKELATCDMDLVPRS